ncbi:hypothetical protein OROMI_009830 [Orobanche minor]
MKQNNENKTKSSEYLFHLQVLTIFIIRLRKPIKERIKIPRRRFFTQITFGRVRPQPLIGNHFVRESPFPHILITMIQSKTVLSTFTQLHNSKFTISKVIQPLELFNCPLKPLGKEYTNGKPVRDDHKVQVVGHIMVQPIHIYVPPQRFKKTRNTVIDISSRLSFRKSVEKSSESLPSLLDNFHPIGNLKIAKVLLSNPTFLPSTDDSVSRKGPSDSTECGASSEVWRHIEVDFPIKRGTTFGNNMADTKSSSLSLVDALESEGYFVVGGGGVGFPIYVAFALSMAKKNYALG